VDNKDRMRDWVTEGGKRHPGVEKKGHQAMDRTSTNGERGSKVGVTF